MATKSYFVRHADSRRADGKRHTGKTALNEVGKKQAVLVASYLSNLKESFGGLATSPSTRTSQTAERIAEKVPVFIETLPILGEVQRFVDDLHYDDPENEAYVEQRKKALENFNIDWRYHPNDESFRDLFHRAIEANKRLMEMYEDQTFIVCGHSQLTAMQHTAMFYGPKATAKQIVESYKYYFLKHTGISVVEKKYGKPWQLLRFNIVDHLK